MPDLFDPKTAVSFYEQRYSQGYMDRWPADRKRRITEVVRSQDLPAVGNALDFGCGNGVLTEVLRQALPPGWTVYGTDICSTAVDNATRLYPHCTFLRAGSDSLPWGQIDFLFTHHVLEHVHDLAEIRSEVDKFLKPDAAMLHVLPCGNTGSFEHTLCSLRKDGINAAVENRFFYEDAGHLRRLNSRQMHDLWAEIGFVPVNEYYANQYYGAINWMTKSGRRFLRSVTDLSPALDNSARRQLQRMRSRLWLYWVLRYPAASLEGRLGKKSWTPRDYLLAALTLLPAAAALPVDRYLNHKARREWKLQRSDPKGSEMYIVFQRRSKAASGRLTAPNHSR